jgi:putative phosphoribosyl transferase
MIAQRYGMDGATSPRMRYANRRQAGEVLAGRLQDFSGREDVVVLGLPRGGIPVAFEVAKALQAPLDVFVVRKLGLPGHPELAMGAIASGGVRVLNEDLLRQLPVPASAIDSVARAEQAELERREQLFRGKRSAVPIEGRTVILADDGLATGSTMRAAVLAIRRGLPSQIVVAVPVGARETCRALMDVADAVICASMPEPFTAVGAWYDDFEQTTDEEVRHLLARHPPGRDVRRSA